MHLHHLHHLHLHLLQLQQVLHTTVGLRAHLLCHSCGQTARRRGGTPQLLSLGRRKGGGRCKGEEGYLARWLATGAYVAHIVPAATGAALHF
jgi:hypothetical protein